ncbi:MAG: Winged helix-turn-helix DNA-binding protein [uncultured archaeon A07HN63]|nr:MAG: Winged helix-turn-helix DNA-binding protein [uncultured archaeon A07HN63]
MLKPTDSASFNDTEQAILEAALQNPDMTNAEIAAETGARVSLVRDVREEHEDEVELPEDDGYGDSGGGGSVDTDADLSSTQEAILAAAAENPEATNADIADETGARLPLVRDTLATHGDAVDAAGGGSSGGSSGSSGGASSAAAGGDLSDAQQSIVEYAADNPDATNREVADAVGARLPTVRDTLAEHGDGGAGGTAGGSSGGAGGSDSDLQSEIVELAEANPEMTNAEIADEAGARVTLVRDTLADNEYSSSEVETAGDGELPAGVDASVLNDTEQAILELAQSDEELTNAEIAAQTGTTVAIVRDTRVKYEPDKSADYGGEGTIEEDDEDEETTTTTDTSREWTPGDPTELQEEILQTALGNEDLTNAEIAAETGARLPLVRDTLADYDDLTLADLEGGVSSSYEPDEPSSWDDLTATQQAILNAAEEDPEATNAEIAEEVGARLPTVRDTRANYEDGIGTGGSAGGDTGESSEPAASDTSAASDDDDGVSNSRLIALAVILLVIVLVLFSL